MTACTTAVFLDRDGVINENRADHVKDWSEFRFLPGALEGIARLSVAGYRVFVISNQAIINRGIVSKGLVEEINKRMVREVECHGGRIDGLAYCPHTADEGCACRKPQPGLLLDLATKHGIELARSTVVGDALSDIEAGQAAGCRTVLVLTGRGREQFELARKTGANGFAVAPDLWAAAELLLRVETAAA